MRVIALVALSAGLLPIAGAVPAPNTEGTVQTAHVNATITSGTIIGLTYIGIESFRGIPYADLPIGDLRFRPPIRLSRHLETLMLPMFSLFSDTNDTIATLAKIDVASSVLKNIAGDTPTKFDEDCLIINVQRPESIEAGANLPVLFSIYGGGFVGGSTPSFDGKNLIAIGVQLN